MYPCIPQFRYIKVGFSGVNITRTCFHDVLQLLLIIFVQVMERDSNLMRQNGPTIFAQAKHMKGIEEIANLILNAHKEATANTDIYS